MSIINELSELRSADTYVDWTCSQSYTHFRPATTALMQRRVCRIRWHLMTTENGKCTCHRSKCRVINWRWRAPGRHYSIRRTMHYGRTDNVSLLLQVGCSRTSYSFLLRTTWRYYTIRCARLWRRSTNDPLAGWSGGNRGGFIFLTGEESRVTAVFPAPKIYWMFFCGNGVIYYTIYAMSSSYRRPAVRLCTVHGTDLLKLQLKEVKLSARFWLLRSISRVSIIMGPDDEK